MPNTVSIESPSQAPDFPSIPLDEDVWNAWMRKNVRLEREHAASRTQKIRWICLVVLVGAAIFSASFFTTADSGYQVSVRFVIMLGGLAVVLQGVRTRQYAFAALFAALMLLFNPIMPAFSFSGNLPYSWRVSFRSLRH